MTILLNLFLSFIYIYTNRKFILFDSLYVAANGASWSRRFYL